MTDASTLKQKNEKELGQLLEEKRQQLWNFRFGASGGKTRNVKEGRTLRREIARILTILADMRRSEKQK
ncbi:MAG: 50S ribosomal protein L29 [Candidatus Taylorbacteria bacterium RIFCSPHIGHO2_01_FULL_46_22b]|uniref:Large ribosomal subunit protein uL29 n=1 Tax=Candidatus Taylorbacteria bacterium RIFCSPHIGHO2_01_FULL_46_22b TaxID=1802301 RepID=A0A1G2M315_9BACT|nr:MAG: 50S ribosomal protein L29 [Candidatus Taylorbacteria bacterium RIFCSPHIGHO2_01_FULL_46_22b]